MGGLPDAGVWCPRVYDLDRCRWSIETATAACEAGRTSRPRGTFLIKQHRKCEFQECYRARAIVEESPVFCDDVPLRLMVRKILKFLPLRSLQLKDDCHGKQADVSRPPSCFSSVAAGGARASASVA